MGWETRKRGGRYYSQKKRVGGKVVSEYVGSGPLAEFAALMDADARDKQHKQRQAWKSLRREDAAIAAFYADVEATLTQELAAAGYHRPNRGQWRKRRGNCLEPQ